MILLADNDIILKLAQCDLLFHLSELLNESSDRVLVTPTARFQLLPKQAARAIEKCGNERTLTQIREFLVATTETPEIQDETLLKALSGVPKIDDGEALLFAAAVEVENPILATGDRNALRALLEHEDRLRTVVAALQERVVTFESTILLALHRFGFAIVKQKLLSSPKPDKVLRLVLKPDMRESDLIQCLRSYTREVKPFLLHGGLVLGE